MKNKILSAAVLILTSLFLLSAKQISSSPLLSGYSFGWYDLYTYAKKGDLQMATAIYQKAKGKSVETYTITGTRSPVRIKIAESLLATDITQSPNADPSTTIELYKLAVDANNRYYSPTNTANSTYSKINFSAKSGGTLVKINFSSPLAPGEYAFIDKTTTATNGNVTAWAFGID
ncbi:MAG: hypothetical protein ABUT20_36405 [Bacteroidota bacterium]